MGKKNNGYETQRKRALTNRKVILRELGQKDMLFSELQKAVNLSSPSLSNHLKKLRKEGYIDKILVKSDDKDYYFYTLTENALKLPEMQNLFFEVATYHRILRELIESGEPITFSTKEERTGKRERLLYWDISSEYLKNKSEYEIVKALDKWLSPITIFSIMQELKGKTNFTESIQGLIEKLVDVVKQKDSTKFEEALNQLYTAKTDFGNVSVMDSLLSLIHI